MTERTLKIFPDDMDEIEDLAECKVLASDADGKPGFINGDNIVEDVANDGKTYARKDGKWNEIPGSIADCATKTYVDDAINEEKENRENADEELLEKITESTEDCVKSSSITNILKVSELPENPDENTLYIIVEDEASTTSETEV